MNKKAAAGFVSRFQAILDELDELEMNEALEELNAEFEDALFMLESIDYEDAEAAEEFADSMEALRALAEEYRELSAEKPELLQKVTELEMCLEMAENNLG